jgi:hypothetical protein
LKQPWRRRIKPKNGIKSVHDIEEKRRRIITESAGKTTITIPGNVLDAIIEMANEDDFHTLVQFFESASHVNLSGLPLRGNNPDMPVVRPREPHENEQPEYGSVAAGRGILID